jgi:hypothetical protein
MVRATRAKRRGVVVPRNAQKAKPKTAKKKKGKPHRHNAGAGGGYAFLACALHPFSSTMGAAKIPDGCAVPTIPFENRTVHTVTCTNKFMDMLILPNLGMNLAYMHTNEDLVTTNSGNLSEATFWKGVYAMRQPWQWRGLVDRFRTVSLSVRVTSIGKYGDIAGWCTACLVPVIARDGGKAITNGSGITIPVVKLDKVDFSANIISSDRKAVRTMMRDGIQINSQRVSAGSWDFTAVREDDVRLCNTNFDNQGRAIEWPTANVEFTGMDDNLAAIQIQLGGVTNQEILVEVIHCTEFVPSTDAFYRNIATPAALPNRNVIDKLCAIQTASKPGGNVESMTDQASRYLGGLAANAGTAFVDGAVGAGLRAMRSRIPVLI